MSHLRIITLTVALATASSGQAVMAQGIVILDERVVTGTRSASPLLDQAENTGKVSQEEIDLIRPDHISEVVNRVSGVNV